MPGVHIELDARAVDKSLGRMFDAIHKFGDRSVPDEFSAWETEDMGKMTPYVIKEDNGASTVIEGHGRAEILDPELQQSLFDRMRDRMDAEIAWKTRARLPSFFRKKKPGIARARWLEWEQQWLEHRYDEFKARYGGRTRFKRILYATAVVRYRHRYPRG